MSSQASSLAQTVVSQLSSARSASLADPQLNSLAGDFQLARLSFPDAPRTDFLRQGHRTLDFFRGDAEPALSSELVSVAPNDTAALLLTELFPSDTPT
jgi:hypothetical protein